MPPAILSVSALLLGTALLLLGNGLYGTLLVLRSAAEGFSPVVIGVIMAAYYLGFLLGCLYCPRLIGSVGHIRIYAALTAIASVASLGHLLQIDAVTWGILRAIVGFCFAGLYMTIESWLNEKATHETRGRIFAVYMMVNLGALGLGQMLLFIADTGTFILFVVTSMLISFAAVPISLASSSPPSIAPSQPLRLLQLWRISPLALVACAGVGLSQGAFWSLTPVFTTSMGLGENGTALFMMFSIFGGLILQLPVGWLSDRHDRRSVISGVCMLAAILAAAVAFVADQDWMILLFITGMLYGGFSMTVYSLAVSHANDHASTTGIVSLSARLLLVYAIGAVIGPLAAGWLMEITAAALYWFVAAVYLLVAAFGIWRQTRRPPVQLDDQTPFVLLSRAGVIAGEFDPRSDEQK
jgi:MFS family permease